MTGPGREAASAAGPPTPNRRVEAAWAYHEGTKHSYQSIRRGDHSLDFSNQPLPFKIYRALPPLPLPREILPVTMPALSAVAALPSGDEGGRSPGLESLATLLYLSAGIIRERRGPGWSIQFRAASCTGALYHIDLYLVCGELPGLPAGVYQFGPQDFALRRLRAGDYRAVLTRATAGETAVAAAPATLIATSTFWRNAWKYQTRAYRHAFWDAGTILANLLAAAAGLALPARLVLGFVDEAVNALIGVDGEREAALGLVALGRTAAGPAEDAPPVAPLRLETVPLSRFAVDDPAIRAMHAASCLVSEAEVATWRGAAPSGDPPQASGTTVPLRPLTEAGAPRDSLTEVIRRRGSTRTFAREPIALAELSTALERATCGVPADCLEPPGSTLNALYLIVHAVDDLAPGAYLYHRPEGALERLREGDFRSAAGYLGLEQALPADACVNVYCLADLHPILARFGNRGYRAAQLEGGILGGKLYLGAYAQRLGATGLTFYDDEVTRFFSPQAAGKSVMFLTALGRPLRRA
jgi:SagB-type dehydrogenase family enzyme